jgi:WD40 repeat protein
MAVALAGDRVATGSADGGVRIHDLARGGAPVALVRGQHQPIRALAASPDGTMFASATDDGRILVWRATDGALLAGHDAHRGGVRVLLWHGDRLYSGGMDNAIKIWRPLVGLAARLDGHQGNLRTIEVGAGDGAILSASSDRTARVWAAPRERVLIAPIGSPARGLAYTRDGAHILVAADDGLHRFDREGRPVDHWPSPPLFDVAISPDGARVAAAGADGSVYWFSPDGTGAPVAVAAHKGSVRRVEFTVDGRELVSTGEDGAVTWWDPSTHARGRSERHDDGVYALATGPGATVWTGSDDRRAYRWERGTDAPAAAATLPEAVNVVVPRRDGSQVLVALEDGSSWLYAPGLDRQLRALGGRGPNVWDAALSRDETLAATVGFEGVLRVYEVDAGRMIAVIPLFTSRAGRLEFSPRGDQLAVVSWTGELALVAWPVGRAGERVPDLSCRTPFVIDGSALRELARPPGCH